MLEVTDLHFDQISHLGQESELYPSDRIIQSNFELDLSDENRIWPEKPVEVKDQDTSLVEKLTQDQTIAAIVYANWLNLYSVGQESSLSKNNFNLPITKESKVGF